MAKEEAKSVHSYRPMAPRILSEPESQRSASARGSTSEESKLPHELVHSVFEHLEADAKEDLAVCALVSRTWHTLVRPYLFRRISYAFAAHDQNLVGQERTLARLHLFLEQHPEIAESVRELHLHATPLHPAPQGSLPILEPTTEYYDPPVLLALLALLPRLDDLRLHDVFVRTPLSHHYSEPLPSLRKLFICSTQDEIPDSDVSILLDCFGAVGHLEINVQCFFDYLRARQECDAPKQLAVSELTFNGSPASELYKHVAGSPSAKSLRVLSLLHMEASMLQQVQNLLSVSGSNLEGLAISFNGMFEDSYVDGPALLDLSCCRALRSLRFSVSAQILDWVTIWYIIGTISAESNTQLERLTLSLRRREDFVTEDTWKVLNVTVLGQTYTALAQLHERHSFREFVLVQGEGMLGQVTDTVFPGDLQRVARGSVV